MSDLAAGLAGRRISRRGAAGVLALLLPLAAAIAFGGPRVWHSVRSEPTRSISVPSLPPQQSPAADQLPTEQPPAPQSGQIASLSRFTARDPFASPLPPAPRKAAATPATALPAAVTPVAAPTTSAPTGEVAAAIAAAPAGAAAGTASATATPAGATSGSATISVNGIVEVVPL